MTTIPGDDEGRRPADRAGMPDTPLDWENIVIPDDASELEAEAAAVRRELRRESRQHRLSTWFGGRDVVIPVSIVALAVIVTLTSLFAVMWPYQPPGRVGTDASAAPDGSAPAATVRTGSPLPDLVLVDGAGTQVRLRDTQPAVLLVTACTCTELVVATAAAAAARHVPVIEVAAGDAPAIPTAVPVGQVGALGDPTGALTGAVSQAPGASTADPHTATVILVDSAGLVTRLVYGAASVESFRADLAKLGG